jgi:hypothetical protein
MLSVMGNQTPANEIAIIARQQGEALTKKDTQQAEQTLALVQQFRVTDPTTFEFASKFLLSTKAEHTRIDAQRKQVTGPFTDALRNLQAFFRRPLDMLEKAEGHLKHEIARYNREIEAQRAAEASAGLPVLAAPPLSEVQGVTIVKTRAFEITDPEQVPRQFCSPDPKKIQAHLDGGGLEAIRGVKFFDRETVRASRGAR